ncbi:MAG: glycerophosphodiester phosphodiesterase [Clostridia bacterium]|nr:glycerophosphodiester phosphodiesterase [Clostridia bacterium]
MIIALIIFLLLLIFALLFVFLTMPRATFRADMELVSTDYAHRGLWGGEIPENSLPAFALAADRGYGIELDVSLSADGEVMVFHDANLKRMCGVDKKLSVLTLAELKTLKLATTEHSIPTFKEVLDTVDGKVPILIELKGTTKDDELCEKLSLLLDNYSGAFCVQSFNPLLLSWFKSYRPRYARGQLTGTMKEMKQEVGPLKAFVLTNMLTNILSRPDFISIHGKGMKRPSFLLATRLFKVKGFVWTVRHEREYKLVRSKGYFAIFENIRP